MISEYYSDETIINGLTLFFDEEEREEIDFNNALSTIEEYDEDYFIVIVKNRSFLIHKILGGVDEL